MHHRVFCFLCVLCLFLCFCGLWFLGTEFLEFLKLGLVFYEGGIFTFFAPVVE